MCLAIPMKILEIDGVTAVTAVEGVTRRIRLDLLPDVSVGDYVLVHAGLAIATVDAAAARETLEILQRLADEVP
jgi:hydrogenase expression/formation protein HypC|uniref:HypC/HybG/HupF family hydrogenase formation chaperone n=1 Tax=Desulfobacca acetoxidans TaxID=60893 RepID=A0A7C3WSA4_9BACT